MKLLNKTLPPFLLYSLVVLALSVPVYFFVIDFLWKNELDKHHTVVRKKIEKELNALQLSDSLLLQNVAVWNKIQPRTKLTPSNGLPISKDSIYTTIRYDEHEEEIEQFRGSVTTIYINNKPYNLLVETNMEEFYETLVVIVLVTVVFFLMLLAGFTILNRRISLRVWKPFYNTLHQLKSFELNGHHKIFFQPSGIDEFEVMNDELSKLIDNNIAAYQQQKEFTENASHELQTPLALLKSKIDLLLQDSTLTREQFEKIASLDIPMGKIVRINKNLLLLSKLENGQITDNTPVQVSQLLSENIDLLEGLLDAKKIGIETHISENITINTNRGLFEIMITNLLLNAIRHNQLHGKITVSLNNHLLTISNTGKSALDPESIFKRFINSSREAPSSGLGLAIVREICNTHHWKVAYTFINGMHNFSVSF